MNPFSEYFMFGALWLAGFAMGTVAVVVPLFIAPRSKGRKTRETYECGMDTIGSAWVRFAIAYYLFALIFVVFEVDVLYILPIAVIFDNSDFVWRDFVELYLFISILLLAIVYAWRKGVFHWK